ncbi:uncharacterized protein LACBIDRAFT_310984 [Laccaria bicolor S238N-H82]|uniref:Predicted protein n=1 Tax=Laccaria bicolor (strain S238N-H82 / ATCC MYA-4686) TaxID=486041 RepID=B0DVH1_LACBS|nr:uncharacterized protein LACBIDRAFT_310984 [Laccaria bicolor S238N-H82]EDR01384.1 predicted protein [Laccaria bicolor S238N-H82]|eukprot:XP_001887929.1 predicted protein [Laccaria bicolor S238N-H82]
MTKVVCRATNRTIVGLPLCRNPDYLELTTQFAADVVTMSSILRLVPPFLRPIINHLFTKLPQRLQRGMKHLKPIIDSRREEQEKIGNGYEKPLDFLSWLMEAAQGEEQTIENLTRRVLVVNFAAITRLRWEFQPFVHALFYLAALPEYIGPLRAEVEEVIEREGWSKEALDQMHKVDSFIKESQRKTSLGTLVMVRIAKEDYTFADGTHIPQGTTVGVNLAQAHHDPETYENPKEFDGFRFAKMRLQQDSKKYDIVSTSPEFFTFGYERHACPGRYFAACELKIMLAHNYDVKTENEGPRRDARREGSVSIGERSSGQGVEGNGSELPGGV